MNLVLEIALVIGVGVLARKLNIVRDVFVSQLSDLIVSILLPCLVIRSMSIPFNQDDLLSGGVVVLLAIGVLAIEFAIGHAIYVFTKKGAFGRIARFSIMFTNFNFIGIALAQSLIGERGLFYYMLFIIPVRICYFSFARKLLAPPDVTLPDVSIKDKLRGWFSVPVIAVIIGMVFYITGFRLPKLATNVMNSMASLCSPLGLLLCGIVLGGYNIKQLMRACGLWVTLLRNAAIPGIMFVIGKLTGVDALFMQIVILYAATPVAALLTTFIVRYDKDATAHVDAASAFLLSTILAVVTLPVWVYVMRL